MAELKRKKRFFIIVGAVLVVLVTIISLIVIDYHNYQRDGKSYLFKHKLSYSQNEVLNIGSISVHLTSAKAIPADKAGSPLCLYGTRGVLTCYNPPPSNGGEPGISLNFTIKNKSNSPVDLSQYRFKVIANTSLDYASMNVKAGQMLANSQINASYKGYVDPNYKGPYDLAVSHNSIQETIAVTKYSN